MSRNKLKDLKDLGLKAQTTIPPKHGNVPEDLLRRFDVICDLNSKIEH